MKKLKSILVLTLALVLALATAVPAFAATIQISDTINGQTYDAYKVLDVITNGNSYAYYIKKDSPWLPILKSYMGSVEAPGFLIKEDVEVNGSYEVIPNVGMSTAPLAKYLAKNKGSIAKSATIDSTADGSTVSLNVDDGFYLVTSSLGSICIMLTATGDTTPPISEKNTRPTIIKKIKTAESTLVDSTSASVGDKVEFQLTVKASKGADDVYTVTDTMTDGLTFDPTATDAFTIKLYKNATPAAGTSTAAEPEIVDKENYTIITPVAGDTFDFKIVFTKEFTANLLESDEIVIAYTATLNADAINRDKETNTVLFNYKNIEKSDDVDVNNYGFGLVKTGSNRVYLGDNLKAHFELYRDEGWTQKIELVKDYYKDAEGHKTDEWCYRPAMVVGKNEDGSDKYEDGVVDYIEAGYVKIDGLAGLLPSGGSSIYYLKETFAPSGYNKVLTPIPVHLRDADKFHTVTKAEDGTVSIEIGPATWVANAKGTVIPTTGGIGTTIFYVLGSILLIGAGVLLVTRKRMNTTK